MSVPALARFEKAVEHVRIKTNSSQVLDEYLLLSK